MRLPLAMALVRCVSVEGADVARYEEPKRTAPRRTIIPATTATTLLLMDGPLPEGSSFVRSCASDGTGGAASTVVSCAAPGGVSAAAGSPPPAPAPSGATGVGRSGARHFLQNLKCGFTG